MKLWIVTHNTKQATVIADSREKAKAAALSQLALHENQIPYISAVPLTTDGQVY